MDNRPAKGLSRFLLVTTLLIVAANMRPALTVVGPLIERIGSDTGLSAAALGLLGALPVFTFAAVSPFIHLLSKRWGMERTIFVALLVLTAGTVLRSLPGVPYTLFTGTVILSAAIAVANVLVPSIVKRDFPDRVPTMTGLYTASFITVAAIASGVAVPVADTVGWQYTLAASAVLPLLAAALWALRMKGQPEPTLKTPADSPRKRQSPVKERSVWASPLAWQVTIFFGFQSSMFYFFLTWLAAIHTYHGYSEQAAGISVGVYQAVGVVATLLGGPLMQRMRDHRAVALVLGAGMAAGSLGMIYWPALMPVWSIISGLSSAATLLLALTMISLRTNSSEQAGRLSGMAQGIGYLIGGSGPILAGNLFALTGSWSTPLYVTLGVVVVYTSAGYLASRDVKIEPRGR